MFPNTRGIVAACAATMVAVQSLSAATVDLTAGEGSSGTINGAIFEFRVEQPAGTGVINSFVRLQRNGIEQGYNTSGRPVPFDEKTDPNFTRDLTFGEVPIIVRDGVQYLEFLLDINEPNSASTSLITMTELQIYTSPIGSQTTTTVSSLGVLRYDLDAGGDSQVILDHRAAEGSGKSDMAVLIPLEFFAGVAASDFLYLYSQFHKSGAGFEEWAVRSAEAQPIPAPAAAPMGLALLALAGWLRRSRIG